MSTYRNKLLAEVCGLCQQLLDLRLALVRTQDRVSDTARKNALELQDGYVRIYTLDPFPDEGEVDESPLAQLKTALSDPDHDAEDREQILLDWLQTIAPLPAESTTDDAASPSISPLNQRMLDATFAMRSTIDATRARLMQANDYYDRAAYKASRNDFTLLRATFDRQLQNDQANISVVDAVRAETKLTPAIETATGANFPKTIQDAADFMRGLTYVFA